MAILEVTVKPSMELVSVPVVMLFRFFFFIYTKNKPQHMILSCPKLSKYGKFYVKLENNAKQICVLIGLKPCLKPKL